MGQMHQRKTKASILAVQGKLLFHVSGKESVQDEGFQCVCEFNLVG